jgi:hypothetical protein
MPRMRTHPGEILAEEYFNPLASRRVRWLRQSVCLQTASLTSSDKDGTCQPTPQFDSANSLRSTRAFG